MDDLPDWFGSNDKRRMALFVLGRMKEIKCLICRGFGHYAYQCTSRKKADKMMKNVELSCEWGDIKSNIMLENYAEKNRIYNSLMNEANMNIRAMHHGYHRPMIVYEHRDEGNERPQRNQRNPENRRNQEVQRNQREQVPNVNVGGEPNPETTRNLDAQGAQQNEPTGGGMVFDSER